MENFDLRKYLTESKLLKENISQFEDYENQDALSQLIMLLSKAIPLADNLMEDKNVGEMYDFAELSQQLENFTDDLKGLQ